MDITRTKSWWSEWPADSWKKIEWKDSGRRQETRNSPCVTKGGQKILWIQKKMFVMKKNLRRSRYQPKCWLNQKPAAGGGRELISWHWWNIDDGDTTILYKTFERGFILWYWGVMEGDGTMIEQYSLCLVTDWDILSFFLNFSSSIGKQMKRKVEKRSLWYLTEAFSDQTSSCQLNSGDFSPLTY